MKERQPRLLLLLTVCIAVSVALWLGRGLWLHMLLSLVPELEKWSNMLQGVEAFLAILSTVGSFILACWLGLSGQTSRRQDRNLPEFADVLQPITPQQIKVRSGEIPGSIQFVDRKAAAVSDLFEHHRVVIVGGARQGKSREAAELITRIMANEKALEGRVYEPGNALPLWNEEDLRNRLERGLYKHRPVLLFIEDISRRGTKELRSLKWLLSQLESCSDLYVIATACDSEIDERHEKWLRQADFHSRALSDFNQIEMVQFIKNASDAYKVLLDQCSLNALVEAQYPAPEFVIRVMEQLSTGPVDCAVVIQLANTSLPELRKRARADIQRRSASAEYVLGALARFHMAGVTPYVSLVMGYATHRWSQDKRVVPSFWLRYRLSRAMRFLQHFGVTAQGVIIGYDAGLIEDLVDRETALAELGRYLCSHRWVFHRYGLQRLYRDRKHHAYALFELAENVQSAARTDTEFQRAREFYKAAVKLSTRSVADLLVQGKTLLHLGRIPEAIGVFSRVLELDSQCSDALRLLGDAFLKQQEHDDARLQYEQAIQVNPQDADAWFGLGIARQYLFEEDEAKKAYGEAIRLRPEESKYYIHRAEVLRRLGEDEEAERDLVKAKDLP